MAFRFVVLVALCAVAYGQQCETEIQSFHQCVRDSHKRDGPPGGDDFRTRADKCFTDNGCDTPKPPGQGPPPNGQNGQGQGPPGSGGDNRTRQCFEAVHAQLKGALTACVQKTDPSFTAPSKPPEFGERGPGGPGGPGGRGPPGGFGGPLQFVQAACNNAPSGAADKVRQCLAAEFQKRGPPSQDVLRQEFNKRCDAKKACDSKLSQTCRDKMEKLFPVVCQCHKDLKAQAQQVFQQQPACSGLQFPEKMPGPFNDKDCSKKPEDPCQQGFDAFLLQRQQQGQGGRFGPPQQQQGGQ